MSIDRLLFQRPEDARLHVERIPTDDTCPECDGRSVARYPVANFLGPRVVVKCQDCFAHLSVMRPTADDHWPPWRAPARDWPASRLG